MTRNKLLLSASLGFFLSGCVVIDPLPPIEERRPGAGFPTDTSSTAPSDSTTTIPDTSVIDATENEATQTVAIATPESVQRPTNTKRSSAAATLREKAQAAVNAGDYAMAERHMQRALRIAPKEAENYAQLATIRLEEDKTGEALQLARKGLTLSPDFQTRSQLQDIIALAQQ